jgi:hypothetical protein
LVGSTRFAINFIFDKKFVKKETQYFEKRIFYHKLSSFFKCEVVIKKTLFLGERVLPHSYVWAI